MVGLSYLKWGPSFSSPPPFGVSYKNAKAQKSKDYKFAFSIFENSIFFAACVTHRTVNVGEFRMLQSSFWCLHLCLGTGGYRGKWPWLSEESCVSQAELYLGFVFPSKYLLQIIFYFRITKYFELYSTYIARNFQAKNYARHGTHD